MVSSTNSNTTDHNSIVIIMVGNPTDLDPRVQKTYCDVPETEVQPIIVNACTTIDNRVMDQHSDVSNVASAYAQISPVTVQLNSEIKFLMGKYENNCIIVKTEVSFSGEMTFKPDKSNATIAIKYSEGKMQTSVEQELFNNTKFSFEGSKASLTVFGVKQTLDYAKGSTPLSLASKAHFNFPKVNLNGLEVELNIIVEAEYTLSIDKPCIKNQLKPGKEMKEVIAEALILFGIIALASEIAAALAATAAVAAF